MGEFDLIRQIQAIFGEDVTFAKPAILGIGDDAALLEPSPGHHLVVTTDTLVAGVHFSEDTDPADIGYKALAVNLSDLAAMGSSPRWFFLSLTLPINDASWLRKFVQGLAGLAGQSGIQLCGGDTTSGPLAITITALGEVEAGAALRRNTASVGDLVVVSGTPGEAGLGLRQIQHGLTDDPAARTALLRPVPRLKLGVALHGVATACIDISDGLLADLGHIVDASPGVGGATIQLAELPVADSLAQLEPDDRWMLQTSGGDDYELCFTVAPGSSRELAALASQAGIRLTVVGELTAQNGIHCMAPGGQRWQPARHGFDHFSDD